MHRPTFRALAALALTLAPSAPALAGLSRAEQRMAQIVEREEPRTIAMLERWVNQNSGTLNLPGVTKVGEMVRAELEPLGFTVEWVDMKAAGRAGHVIARHKGNGRGKRMLLIGHIDTVFEPDSPFQRWQRDGDRATGPGIADDKGGTAVLVAALRAMHQAGTLKKADITIVLTGDEEDPGEPLAISRRDLIAAGQWADVALDFEPLARDEGRDMATVARRSAGSWTVSVTAAGGHSSGVFSPGLGFGAIYELARILDAFRRELREPMLTYNVGLVGGGDQAALDGDRIRLTASGKTNIVANKAVARGDLRALDAAQIERTRAKMRAIVAAPLPGAKAEISFDDDGYPPMAPSAGNRAVLAKLNRVVRDLGQAELGELAPDKRGAADISFVAGDVDGLSGLGAAGGGAHAPGEWLDLKSIAVQAKRAAILMSRLAAERR